MILRQPTPRNRVEEMSAFVKKYPAISLLVPAMIFGFIPSIVVVAGVLPPSASQLAALSSILPAEKLSPSEAATRNRAVLRKCV